MIKICNIIYMTKNAYFLYSFIRKMVYEKKYIFFLLKNATFYAKENLYMWN